MPDPVLNAVVDHLRREAPMGAYEAASRAPIAEVYVSIARLLGCDPSEVALTDNSTRAWNAAFSSVRLQSSDRILVSRAEFINSSLTLLQASQRTGVTVEVIPCDETGQLSIPCLREMMDERVRLIVVTHMPTNGGLVNPVAEVGQVAREWNCLYLLDASQSLGQIPIDVKTIGCHLLSAPGRKYLRGPRGTGILYASKSVMDRLNVPAAYQDAGTWPTFDQYIPHPDARRFEIGECSVAGRLGLGAAVEYALAWGIDNIWDRVRSLGEALRAGLMDVPGITVRDLGRIRGGIVSFTHERLTPETIMSRLAEQRINVKASPARQARLDMDARGLASVARASVHYYNSEAELARFIEALKSIIRDAD